MKSFKIKGMEEEFVSFDTIGDGSCLLHSILFCFNKKYRESSFRERILMVHHLRNCLAKVLEEKNNITGETYYKELSRGEIEQLSKEVPELNLNSMQKYLSSRNYLNMFFLELISEQLDIDIYIINSHNGTIYMTGDEDIYYKERRSVIIKYIDQAHFEAVGYKGEKIETLFHKDSFIIKELRGIMKEKNK